MFSFTVPSLKSVAVTTAKVAAVAAGTYGALVLVKKYGGKITAGAANAVDKIDQQIVGG